LQEEIGFEVKRYDDVHFTIVLIRNAEYTFIPLKWPYDIVQKLISWHFDVFGLIDKGLAVALT
jgi:hypothetical protein